MQAYDLNYIGIGLATGGGVGAARYDGKTITIDDWSAEKTDNLRTYATNDEGNRTDIVAVWSYHNFDYSWYIEPVAAGKPIWAKIITENFPTVPYVSASASRPIYDAENRLLGMSAIDIHLPKISDFLRATDIAEAGRVFILERDGALIATSTDEQPFKLVDDTVKRLYAIESVDTVVRAIAQHFEQNEELQSIEEKVDLRLEVEGETHFIHAEPWRDSYGLDWVVITSVPESTFMGQINRNTRMTIALCLGALGLTSGLGLFAARWIARPVLRLNQASEAMASGNLSQTVEKSGIRELDSLSQSFNHMAE
ncbi:MAG: hypothetical protein OHK0037_17820 [Elainellaceae cyanobacterium]